MLQLCYDYSIYVLTIAESADPRDQATHEVVDEAGQSPNSRLLAAVGICWGTTGARTVQDVPQTLGNHTEAQGPKADVARRPHTATIVPMDSENMGRTHKDVNPKDNAAPSPRAIEGTQSPRLTADDSIPYSHSTSSPLIVASHATSPHAPPPIYPRILLAFARLHLPCQALDVESHARHHV
ncbi:hypothetical protein BD779DRAFT_1494098, partial [Infundibulicybe gibba]